MVELYTRLKDSRIFENVLNTMETFFVQFTIETEREDGGRWIAEVLELSGALKYGATRELAIAQAEALALRVMAERIEAGEYPVEPVQISFTAA